MGTKLADIIEAQTLALTDLSGKTLAIDAFNTIYSFLATIRQPDGTPLTDRHGRVTSHLSGLFYRNVNLLENGISPVYVFDGESPELKAAEVQRRREIRDSAYEEWKIAKEEGRIEDARRAGQASSRLTGPMIDESKDLLHALGIPVIQAPSEGEAIAAQMARDNLVWASASQDNDSLLYNCPRMIRNLSISGRRRVARSQKYKNIDPELIVLDINLKLLGISREQLIDIAILVGTDYNDGVKGIGPKTALKLVKGHSNLEGIEKDRGEKFDIPYDEIREIFLHPPKMDISAPKWTDPKPNDIVKILCKEHDFSDSRVEKSLERLHEALEENRGSTHQSALSDFF
ncbi:MAG: flap endonuclease-1 [Candidatus Thorarchaeota archaeon]|nr:flap endonuclease-1 [Candidatus Thorarchaeota archaeon]